MKNKLTKITTVGALIISSLALNSCDSDNNSLELPIGPTDVTITYSVTGPVAFAPVFFAAHQGDFDFFDTGSAASAELEEMAELGSPAEIIATLRPTDNSVTTGAPLAPGDEITLDLTIDEGNRFFSYGGMVLPSSDTFVGNNNPVQYDILEMLANSSTGSVTIDVTRLYDAGTEVNDFLTSPGGALVGAPVGNAEEGVEENGVITLSSGDFYNEYLNAGDFDVSTINPNGQVVGQITITRSPTTESP